LLFAWPHGRLFRPVPRLFTLGLRLLRARLRLFGARLWLGLGLIPALISWLVLKVALRRLGLVLTRLAVAAAAIAAAT
jgi:hypothetical protein